MEQKITGIQQLINNKADAKLKADLKLLQKSVCSGVFYELIKGISLNVGTSEKPRNIDLYAIFNQGFGDKIIENNIERYREAEAKLFLDKVESLREDVDNLLDSKNYD